MFLRGFITPMKHISPVPGVAIRVAFNVMGIEYLSL